MLKLLVDFFEDIFFFASEKDIMGRDVWLRRYVANIFLALLTISDFVGVFFAFQI